MADLTSLPSWHGIRPTPNPPALQPKIDLSHLSRPLVHATPPLSEGKDAQDPASRPSFASLRYQLCIPQGRNPPAGHPAGSRDLVSWRLRRSGVLPPPSYEVQERERAGFHGCSNRNCKRGAQNADRSGGEARLRGPRAGQRRPAAARPYPPTLPCPTRSWGEIRVRGAHADLARHVQPRHVQPRQLARYALRQRVADARRQVPQRARPGVGQAVVLRR